MKERPVRAQQFHGYETPVHHSLRSTIQLLSNVDVSQTQIISGVNKVSFFGNEGPYELHVAAEWKFDIVQ